MIKPIQISIAAICISSFALISCGERHLTTKTAETASSQPKTSKTSVIQNVSAKQAAELLAKQPDLGIIDVRTPQEFAQGHLKGAINVNFKAPDFDQKLAKLDKTKPYLLHCRSGHRSGNALRHFRALGFRKIYHMNKGMNDWLANGLPVEK